MNQVLWNKGLKSSEMIEQKDITHLYRVIIVFFLLVQFYIQFQEFPGRSKSLHAPVIGCRVDRNVIRDIRMIRHNRIFFDFTPILSNSAVYLPEF